MRRYKIHKESFYIYIQHTALDLYGTTWMVIPKCSVGCGKIKCCHQRNLMHVWLASGASTFEEKLCAGVCVHRAWKGVGLCILVLNGSRPYTKQWKGTQFKTPLLLVGHGLGFLHLLSVWKCKRAIDCSVLWLLLEVHNLHWAYVSKTCSLYQKDQD